MASPGLLFLLLVSSSLLLSSVSSPAGLSWSLQQEDTKTLESNKKGEGVGKFIISHIDQVRLATTPFLALIPVYGPLISAFANLALLGVTVGNTIIQGDPVLNAIKSEFANLNYKIDKNHAKQIWTAWVSGPFHKPEESIEVAWIDFTHLMEDIPKATNDEKKEQFKQKFLESYSKHTEDMNKLYVLMKVEPPSLMSNLVKELADHVNCHEKEIREYTVLIMTLVYKSNLMNQFYNKLKNMPKEVVDKDNKMAHKIAEIMLELNKYCITHSRDKLEEEVKEFIIKNKDIDSHQELSNRIWLSLVDIFDRYDWMVVATKTENIHYYKLHILSGFTEVKEGDMTVAVVRQEKGTHREADEVKRAIQRCIPGSVTCDVVIQKLQSCKEIKDSQPYTAVHAFIREGDESHDANELGVYFSSSDPTIPFIYRGKCYTRDGMGMTNSGTFLVLIKSDEERLGVDPCSKRDCGGEEKGKCSVVKNSMVAVCDCKYPYFGQNCEESIKDYEKEIEKLD